MKNSLHALLVAAAALLAACGGSSEGDDGLAGHPPTTSGVVPPGATATVQAYVAYAGSLLLTDRGAPVNVDGVQPPTSETEGPTPVN